MDRYITPKYLYIIRIIKKEKGANAPFSLF